jgi:hypothetical protein
MLGKLFAKKKFEEVDYYLEAAFEAAGLEWSAVKFRKKPATYNKPYTLLAEGNYKGHHLIVSLWAPPISVEDQPPKLDLILTIENTAWLHLDIFHQNSASIEKKALDMVRIPFLEELEQEGIIVETNNKFFVLEQFNHAICMQLKELNRTGFERMKVERQKIYIQTHWLPDHVERQKQLSRLLQLLFTFSTIIDQPSHA